jgi:hypothetical protein
MIGSAPNCRPECLLNSECPSNTACINQKCVDPCLGTCAPNGECRVINHRPVCSCAAGYSGDGFSSCRPTPVVGKIDYLGIRRISMKFSFGLMASSFAKLLRLFRRATILFKISSH